ncbi:MAG TPA: hypothetical protein PKC69_09080 [Chitinophagaceae bacterium]|nr:hypothetical protein [Chitinophagaceae bacterium]
MNKYTLFFPVWLCVAAGIIACSLPDRNGRAKEQLAIKECFDKYKKAILTSNGPLAQAMVDSETVSFYERVLKHARFSEKAQLSKAGLSEKLIVFKVRQEINGDSVRKYSGAGLFTAMVSSGMMDVAAMSAIDIGKVDIAGSAAKAEVTVNKKMAPFTLRFRKENGGWKINIAALLAITDMALTEKINQAGLTEEFFIEDVMMRRKGAGFDNNQYWKPLH